MCIYIYIYIYIYTYMYIYIYIYMLLRMASMRSALSAALLSRWLVRLFHSTSGRVLLTTNNN